jgi:hypothetical protein
VPTPSLPGLAHPAANAKPENTRRKNTKTMGRQRQTVRTKASRAGIVFLTDIFPVKIISVNTPSLFSLTFDN